MFMKGGRLYYDYKYLDGVYYTMASPVLAAGETETQFKFSKTREFGGTGELCVNGEKVAEQDMPRIHISTYSLAETFDIG
jgi:arylsulfatase